MSLTILQQKNNELSEKLERAESICIAMAQELTEMIGDAEDAGCKNPFPACQQLIDEWDEYHAENLA